MSNTANDLLANAIRLLQYGQLLEARSLFERVLKKTPKNVSALHFLGMTYTQNGEHQQGIPFLKKAVAIAPDYVDAQNNLGVALREINRPGEAIACYRKALSMDPNYVEAHYNLGNALQDLKRLEEAMTSYRKVLSINPGYAEVHNNLGNIFKELGRPEEALACYQNALSFKRDYPDAHNNLGSALQDLNRYQEAVVCHERALSIKPDNPEARWNRSQALLTLGQFQQGWQDYEMRWKRKGMTSLFEAPYPCWLGETPIAGKKLLIQFEQGLGDAIQMLRYIPLLQQQGVECWIHTPPALLGLITRSFPDTHVTDNPCPTGMDYRILIMSLPLAMRTFSEQDIPKGIPYLAPDPARATFWKTQLASPTFSRTVGLVWRGNPGYKGDNIRSTSVTAILPLIIAHPSVQFVTLHHDLTEAERTALEAHPNVRILLTNFDETAAVISALDLIISINSSLGHLTGALGKPLWMLLPFSSEWRWGLERSDSP